MKYVVVTGAYGGMGYQTVKFLVDSGYTVFALDKVVKEAEPNVIPIEVDLTNYNSVENAFNIVSSKTSEIFSIIHFAGIYNLDSLIEIPEADFDKIFKVNLYGAYSHSKAFVFSFLSAFSACKIKLWSIL